MTKTDREAIVASCERAHELGIKLRAAHDIRSTVKWEDIDLAATALSLLAGMLFGLLPPADDEGDTK